MIKGYNPLELMDETQHLLTYLDSIQYNESMTLSNIGENLSRTINVYINPTGGRTVKIEKNPDYS